MLQPPRSAGKASRPKSPATSRPKSGSTRSSPGSGANGSSSSKDEKKIKAAQASLAALADVERLKTKVAAQDKDLKKKDRLIAKMQAEIEASKEHSMYLTGALAAKNAENERIRAALADPTRFDVDDFSVGLDVDSDDEDCTMLIAPPPSLRTGGAARSWDAGTSSDDDDDDDNFEEEEEQAAGGVTQLALPSFEHGLDHASCSLSQTWTQSSAGAGASAGAGPSKGTLPASPKKLFSKLKRATSALFQGGQDMSAAEPAWLGVLRQARQSSLVALALPGLPACLQLSPAAARLPMFCGQCPDSWALAQFDSMPSNQRATIGSGQHYATMVRELNLSGMNLALENMHCLARALAVNTWVTHIDLSDNSLCDDSVRLLCRALAANQRIAHVDLSRNDFGHEGAQALAELLSAGFTGPAEELVYGGPGAATLVACGLVSLSLSGNEAVGSKGIASLASSLKRNSRSRLIHLNVGTTRLGTKGAQSLAMMLMQNSVLEELFVSGPRNDVGVAGSVALSSALMENKSLRKLWVARNNIASEGCQAFVEALSKNKTLREIDFSYNLIKDSAGISILKLLEEQETFGEESVDRMNLYAHKFSARFMSKLSAAELKKKVIVFENEEAPSVLHAETPAQKMVALQGAMKVGASRPRRMKTANEVLRIVEKLKCGQDVERVPDEDIKVMRDKNLSSSLTSMKNIRH